MKRFQLFADNVEKGIDAGLKYVHASGNVVVVRMDVPPDSLTRTETAEAIQCDEITIFERKDVER